LRGNETNGKSESEWAEETESLRVHAGRWCSRERDHLAFLRQSAHGKGGQRENERCLYPSVFLLLSLCFFFLFFFLSMIVFTHVVHHWLVGNFNIHRHFIRRVLLAHAWISQLDIPSAIQHRCIISQTCSNVQMSLMNSDIWGLTDTTVRVMYLLMVIMYYFK